MTYVRLASNQSGLKHPLDELTQQMRGRLARRLAKSTVWAPAGDLKRLLLELRMRGQVLCTQLLAPLAVNRGDFDTRDGASAPLTSLEFPTRLPFVMSFGYEMGLGIHAVIQASDKTRQDSARLCALFNVGISLFDQASDKSTLGLDTLQKAVNIDGLMKLIEEPGESVRLLVDEEGAYESDLTMLKKVIGEFFSELHDIDGALRSESWNRLAALLVQAYQAEIACIDLSAADRSIASLIEAAQTKSTLPFVIMLQIIRICAKDLSAVQEAAGSELVQRLGVIFRLVDDLADLARDFRSGAVNTLLLQTPELRDYRTAGGSEAEAAHVLISSGRIDDAVEILGAHLDGVNRTVAVFESYSLETGRFQEVLLAYVRSWIGSYGNYSTIGG